MLELVGKLVENALNLGEGVKTLGQEIGPDYGPLTLPRLKTTKERALDLFMAQVRAAEASRSPQPNATPNNRNLALVVDRTKDQQPIADGTYPQEPADGSGFPDTRDVYDLGDKSNTGGKNSDKPRPPASTVASLASQVTRPGVLEELLKNPQLRQVLKAALNDTDSNS